MSVRLAAGCALSRSHGVSVVPMIQCRPHGMTNSTDFSVRTMKPASERIRSRGTTRWMPLDACTCSEPRPPTISWISSVQTPAALTTTRARISRSVPCLEVAGAYADDPLALAEEAGDLDPGGDVRAVARRRCGRWSRRAGRRRPGSRSSGSPRRSTPARSPARSGRRSCGSGAGAGARPCRTCRPSPWRRRAPGRRRRRAAPRPCGSAGRGTAPAGPGAARAGSAAGRAPGAPP